MDLKSFYADDFDAKEWLNNAFKASTKVDKEEFAINTLATLHLYMQQLNHSLEETTEEVVSTLPQLMQSLSATSSSACALRERAAQLQTVLGETTHAQGQPLHALQKTDRLKTELELARQGLHEADKWAALAGKLEAALETTSNVDLPALATLLKDMTDCLDALSGSSDYEDKRLQLEGLKNRLEALLSPAVVEAFTGKDTDRCCQLWSVFTAMGRREALGAYRARCEAAALRAQLPPPGGAAAIRDLHLLLLRHAQYQLDWASRACPGENTLSWLLRLHIPLLREAELSQWEGPAVEGPNMLADALAACDRHAANVLEMMQRQQDKSKSIVPDADLREIGRAIYSPVRRGLSQLGKLLSAAMAEDLGPAASIPGSGSEMGTVLQLRVGRAARSVSTRIAEGKCIARGTAHRQLQQAAQWIIEELCSGWSSVLDLAGCLSLMKSTAHVKQLAIDTQKQIADNTDEEHLSAKFSSLPVQLRNWKDLLRDEGASTSTGAPSPPLTAAPDRLVEHLKKTALKIVLEPIAQHLDGMTELKGWADNEQHALELPDFALSPQEYVTQVGQYLLTLPQHLEPLIERGELSPTTDEDPAYQFLNEVCNAACEMFASKINSIKKMDSLGIRKSSTDIAYLSSILEELGAGSTGLKILSETVSKKQPVLES